MKLKKFIRQISGAFLAVLCAGLLLVIGDAFAQANSGAAAGSTRGGGVGGRDYRGEPTKLPESRELPPNLKGLTDRICDPETLESSAYAGVFQYSCLAPRPSGLTARPGEPPTPRAKIHIDCDEKDGKPVNCVANCGADENSDCSGFISACVDSDHTVEGNKQGAKCFP